MTVTEIRKSVLDMSDKEQKEVLAYLVHLRQNKDPEYLNRITNQIDDENKENWVRWRDVRPEEE
jgi:hypothetical protein